MLDLNKIIHQIDCYSLGKHKKEALMKKLFMNLQNIITQTASTTGKYLIHLISILPSNTPQ